ncbi:MAG: amidohydrolase [Blautia sp.]|nr:amidohydrolase [Blautia sp.]
MNYKIIHGVLLLPSPDGYTTEKKTIYIEGNRISRITDPMEDASFSVDAPSKEKSFETIDASGKLIIPGLINMHTHVYMTIMRNYADDLPFDKWLFQKVMPVEDHLPRECAYWGSLLGLIEMIQTGTSCFVDMHMYHEQSPKAASTAGLRAYIGRGLVGEDLYDDGRRFREAIEEKEKYANDLLSFVLSPHAVYTCSRKLLSQVTVEAQKHGMLKQIHLSESKNEVENCLKENGITPVELLQQIGFLDQETILAHCVHLRGDDIGILARTGASVVTNPASNCKLGNGFAPIGQIRQAGINICLGTDGAASNNSLNLFREMGLLTMIHKGISEDPTMAPAPFIIDSVTRNAAAALGREGELGVIAENALADLVFLDMNSVSLFPANNPLSALCYSANGSEVDSLMVNGRFLMRKREMLTIDTERVYYEVGKIIDSQL